MMRLSAIFTSTTLVAAYTEPCPSSESIGMPSSISLDDSMIEKMQFNDETEKKDPLASVTPEMSDEFDSVFAQLIDVLKAPADELDWKAIIRETGMKPEQLLKEAKEVLENPSLFIDEDEAVPEPPADDFMMPPLPSDVASNEAPKEEAAKEAATQPAEEVVSPPNPEEVPAAVADSTEVPAEVADSTTKEEVVPTEDQEAPTAPVEDVINEKNDDVPTAEDALATVTPELAAELDAVFAELVDVLKAPAEELDWKEIVREVGMKPEELLKEAKEVLENPSMFLDELDGEPTTMPAPPMTDDVDFSDEAINETTSEGQEEL